MNFLSPLLTIFISGENKYHTDDACSDDDVPTFFIYIWNKQITAIIFSKSDNLYGHKLAHISGNSFITGEIVSRNHFFALVDLHHSTVHL